MLKLSLLLIKKDLLKIKNYLLKNSLDKNKIMRILSILVFVFMVYNSRKKPINHEQEQYDPNQAAMMILFIVIFLIAPLVYNKLLNIDKADIVYLIYNKPLEYSGAILLKNLIFWPLFYSYFCGYFFLSDGNILWAVKIYTILSWVIFGNFIASLYRAQHKKIISNPFLVLIAVITAVLYCICLFKPEFIQPLYHSPFLYFLPITGWFCSIQFSQKLDLTIWLLLASYCLGIGIYLFFTLKKVIRDCPEALILMGTDTDLYKINKLKSETSLDNMLAFEANDKNNKKHGAYAFYLKQKYENAKNNKFFLGFDSLIFLFLGAGFGLFGFLSGKEKVGILVAVMLNLIISVIFIVINNGKSSFDMINSHYFWLIPDNSRRKLFYIIKYDLLKIIIDILILNIVLWVFWRFNVLYVIVYILMIPSVFLFNISYSFIAKAVLPFYDATIKLTFINVPLKLFFSIGISILLNFLLFVLLNGISIFTKLELPPEIMAFSFFAIFSMVNLLYFAILYLFFDKIFDKYEYVN